MFASDPIEQYLNAAGRARAQNVDTAPAALATVDASGAPSLRVVLVRGVDARGFVFFTNYRSRKARELTGNPHAALCQHWPAVEEQIRVEGRAELVDPSESDAYFKGRARDSQIGAWASDQSAPLESRAHLEERIAEVDARFAGAPVPRPPFWGGFRIVPARIEFWYGRPGRLHERLLYERGGQGAGPEGWKTSWLYP